MNVDNLFIYTNDVKNTKLLKEHLSIEFKIKDLGEAKYSLSVRITKKKDSTLDKENCIVLVQPSNITFVLRRSEWA